MTAITQLTEHPEFRFAAKRKQGDSWSESFQLVGYASLASHTWRAQVRGKAHRLVATPGVSATTVTVDAADDSVQVSWTVDSATTSQLEPGVYVVDIEDLTDKHTWATGTLEVERDWSHT